MFAGEWKNDPPNSLLDLATTIAFAAATASKIMHVKYAFPSASKVMAGSLPASATCPSSSINCQNGGGIFPPPPAPAKQKSTPPGVDSKRLSVLPPAKILGIGGVEEKNTSGAPAREAVS